MMILFVVLAYFVVLFIISRSAIGSRTTNDTFYRGRRQSPWRMVAFGMVGASVSGVTFVSVPGMVLSSGMTYLQLCLGFILGYLAVAFVLLPLYYRLNLTSIYAYLGQRLGPRSYLTGASFFLLSKMIGSAVKFYVLCLVLWQFLMPSLGAGQGGGDLLFVAVTVALVVLIWLYTRRGGIGTLVYTDTFQTLCMLLALLLIIYNVSTALHFSLTDAVAAIAADERSRIFVTGDWAAPNNFWKMLLSGAFIVIVMTGLDQDMMQKNLTCRTLRDAQKNMCAYGVAFVPVNLLFLSLGILLAQYFQTTGMVLPTHGDQLLPEYIMVSSVSDSPSLWRGLGGGIVFLLGIMAASVSSADSALTSLTTSYCVDICRRPGDERLRRRVHLLMCVLFVIIIVLIRLVNSTSLIDAIYTIVSYTYGPLLGLFAFGLFTQRLVNDRWVPYVCVASPLLCFAIDKTAQQQFDYHFGYELLLLNGLITFLLCLWQSKPKC